MTNWAPPTRIAIGSVCLIASFAMSVITWVALGDIAGYGVMRYVMPAVVDTYIACSLITWLTVNDTQVAALARRNTYGAAVFGVLTQAIYHCAIMWSGDPTHPGHSIWRAGLALICGGIPPAGAFAAAHMIIRAARVTDEAATNHLSGASTGNHQPETPTPPQAPTLPHVITSGPGHATTNTSSTGRPTRPETSTPEAPQDISSLTPTLTSPATAEQTAIPETSPAAAEAQPRQGPAPATPTRGSTAARGHSNTQWARGVTRPTQPRRGSVLSDEEWVQMDGWIDDGIRDFEIGKRMGRSEATVKKRRLERMARRAQRNGNERMVRR